MDKRTAEPYACECLTNYELMLSFHFQSVDEVAGECLIRLGVVLLDATSIAQRGQDGINGQLCQQRRSTKRDQISTVAWTKDLIALTIWRLKVSHVLYHTYDDAFELTHHVDAFHHDHRG